MVFIFFIDADSEVNAMPKTMPSTDIWYSLPRVPKLYVYWAHQYLYIFQQKYFGSKNVVLVDETQFEQYSEIWYSLKG